MTRSIRLPIALAFNIAAGLGTFLALAIGGFAQALPPPAQVPAVFGAKTGNATLAALGAAVYGVAVGGTPASPTLTPTLLSSTPEAVAAPQVSALAFLNNAGGNTNLAASNSSIGDLYQVQYTPGPPPVYSSTDLYNAHGSACGAYATGLGVDGSGNILGAGNMGCSPSPSGPSVFIYEQGDGTHPHLMDSVNHDTGLAGHAAIKTIADAAVAPGTFANGIQAGDLLVLVGGPFVDATTVAPTGAPVVFIYPHSAIAAGLVSPYTFPAAAKALVTQANFPSNFHIGDTYVPNYVPVSMAISPIDGSLLIATADGTIWMIPATPISELTPTGYGTATVYAEPTSGLPRGCFYDCGLKWGKIAAGQQGGSLYVLATIQDTYTTSSESGMLALFWGTVPDGGFTAPSQSVTLTDVQPTSVAVLQPEYKTGTILASECFDPSNPCDIIGDGAFTLSIVQHVQSIPAGATITQQECVVPVDPRGPNCSGGARPLPFKEVCPGLNDTRIIPRYLCGSPGFILFASLAEQVDDTNGIEVRTYETLKTELPPDPGCPALDAVAPYSTGNNLLYGSNEKSLVETQFPEGNVVFEVTNSCIPDPGAKSGPHASVDGDGFALNLGQFAVGGKSGPVGFVDFKFNNLQQTIKNSNIRYWWERLVLQFAVAEAKYLVDVGHYDCAAEIMYLLDRFVRRHVGDFLHSAPGAAVREPNPAFDIIMRLSNAYYRIETGIENHTPNSIWPLAADPHLCRTNECNVFGIDK
jgi:hypothetical protein